MSADALNALIDAASLPLRALLLIAAANGLPIAAKRLLRQRLAWPVDGNRVLRDGQPLFGKAKTVRGLVASVAGTALMAPLLGLPWHVGAQVGAAAMAGDLLSSFVKRRRGLPPSSVAPWLDQLPESLLPVLVLIGTAGLGTPEGIAVVAVFALLARPVSRLMFRLRLRDRPW